MSDHVTKNDSQNKKKRSQTKQQELSLSNSSLDTNKKAKLIAAPATDYRSTVKSTDEKNTVNNTLDALPIELLHDIYGFVGEGNYIGFGNVNKRIYQMYNTYNLPKISRYSGYNTFEDVKKQFEIDFDENDYNVFGERITHLLPICVEISIGIILFNRKDLQQWAQREQNIYLTFTIYCVAAFYGRLIF